MKIKEVTMSEMIREIMTDKGVTNSDISRFRNVTRGSNNITIKTENIHIGTLKDILESLAENLIIIANKKKYKIK